MNSAAETEIQAELIDTTQKQHDQFYYITLRFPVMSLEMGT